MEKVAAENWWETLDFEKLNLTADDFENGAAENFTAEKFLKIKINRFNAGDAILIASKLAIPLSDEQIIFLLKKSAENDFLQNPEEIAAHQNLAEKISKKYERENQFKKIDRQILSTIFYDVADCRFAEKEESEINLDLVDFLKNRKLKKIGKKVLQYLQPEKNLAKKFSGKILKKIEKKSDEIRGKILEKIMKKITEKKSQKTANDFVEAFHLKEILQKSDEKILAELIENLYEKDDNSGFDFALENLKNISDPEIAKLFLIAFFSVFRQKEPKINLSEKIDRNSKIGKWFFSEINPTTFEDF